MRSFVFVVASLALWSAGCSSEAGKGGTGSTPTATPATTPSVTSTGPASGSATAGPAVGRSMEPAIMTPPPVQPAVVPGHDFTETGRALLAVGACGGTTTVQGLPPDYIAKHCVAIRKVQDEYKKAWVDKARAFFAEQVPADVPKVVVYPFAGGDLSTALTVYPDADEITTMSLEPAGDPRTLAALTMQAPGKGKRKVSAALDKAMETIRYELRFLYKVNFSNTMNMIEAMRGGGLPTQLVFGLSALEVHGFEVVALRYFTLDPEGAIVYLTDDDVANAPAVDKARAKLRNERFANAEVRFRRPGGRVQIYRHLQVNLDNEHLAKDPRVLRHLEAKGKVAAMTKAASYLLSWSGFSMIRDYLIGHAVWMVSDATGVPPRYGQPAGFEYETYGMFVQPHIGDGQADWRVLWAKQPKRKLPFRFGYYDGSPSHTNHLVIMRRP